MEGRSEKSEVPRISMGGVSENSETTGKGRKLSWQSGRRSIIHTNSVRTSLSAKGTLELSFPASEDRFFMVAQGVHENLVVESG